MKRTFDVGPYRSDGEVIGKGSYSVVFKAVNVDTMEPVAIKVVDLYHLSSREPSKYRNLRDRLRVEIKIAQTINHQNLVTLREVLEEDDKVYLVFEFCEDGDLSKHLEKVGVLNEIQARSFLTQIISGLEYLHTQNIIHRDLKPQNILLKKIKGPKEKYQLKIADFGFAKRIKPQDMSATICGSPLYMAPQLLNRCEYSFKADIWSLGVVMYEMITGNKPIEAANPMELINNIKHHKIRIPGYLSEDAQSLLKGLLRRNEDQRLSIKEVSSHPFFISTKTQPSTRTHSLPRISPISSEKFENYLNPALKLQGGSHSRYSDTSVPTRTISFAATTTSRSKGSEVWKTQSQIRILCELFYGVEELQSTATQNTEYTANVLVYIYTQCLLIICDIINDIKILYQSSSRIPKKLFKITEKCIYRYEQLRLAVFQLKNHINPEDTAPVLPNIIFKTITGLESKTNNPRTDIHSSYRYTQSAIILLVFLHRQSYFDVNRDNIDKEISRFLKKKRLIKRRGDMSSSSLLL